MNCELCEQEEAFMTLIPTGGDGLPQSIGPACFARMGLEMAKSMLPAEEIAQSLGPMFVTPAREDLHEAHEAAKSRKSKGKGKTPEAPEGTAGGAPETQAAAAE